MATAFLEGKIVAILLNIRTLFTTVFPLVTTLQWYLVLFKCVPLKLFGAGGRLLKNLTFIGYGISPWLQHLSLKNSECTWKSQEITFGGLSMLVIFCCIQITPKSVNWNNKRSRNLVECSWACLVRGLKQSPVKVHWPGRRSYQGLIGAWPASTLTHRALGSR